MKRSAMKPGKPMRRSSPLLRSRMKRTANRLTAAERAIYRQATENARNADGVLICARCREPIRDGEEARDHIRSRGAGGKTTLDNLQILHAVTCHPRKHGERVIEPEAKDGGCSGGGRLPALASEAMPREGVPIG